MDSGLPAAGGKAIAGGEEGTAHHPLPTCYNGRARLKVRIQRAGSLGWLEY